MYICDSHVHSLYSYDSESPLEAICEKAIGAGLSEVCITDHYDANLDTGDEPIYDAVAAEAGVRRIASEYAGKLKVTYGLELGQPHELPDCTKAILAAHDFDFIIGSLHNARGEPDYYCVPFEKMDDAGYKKTMDAYFEQTLEMLEFGGFHTLGHFGYPWRLSVGKGHPTDAQRHRAAITGIFRYMISNGIALEVNTSGLRREDVGTTHPLPEMLEWYREMGGRLLTVGSDAHSCKVVGAGIPETHKMLRDIGFTEYTVFCGGKPVQKQLIK